MKKILSNLSRVLSLTLSVLVIVSIFTVPADATAGINRIINFHGKVVTASNSQNVPDATYPFVFKLYNASSGGSAIWTESYTTSGACAPLQVTGGLFRASLGSCASFASAGVDFNTDQLWLEVTFNSETTTSRVQFTAVPYAFNAEKVAGLTVTNNGGNTLNIAASKTFTASNTLTLSGTDGSTLNIGTGGTLGTGAYATIANYAPLASPTFTGTVTIPSPFTLGSTSVTTNGTQLNYLNAATGTTGTTSTNLVFSGSPTIAMPTFTTSATTPLLIGGTGTTSPLSLRSTSGVGATGADIIFQTGNNGATEAMRILNNGNVGIGNSAPGFNLDVTGAARFTGAITVGSCTGCGSAGTTWNAITNPTGALSLSMAANTSTFTYNATTSTANLFNLTDTASNTGTGYLLNVTTATSSTLKPLHISAAGTEAMTILSNGNVGIGITTPAEKLEVNTNAQFDFTVKTLGYFFASGGNSGISTPLLFENYDTTAGNGASFGLKLSNSNQIQAVQFGKESGWTATTSTQNSYMQFNNFLAGIQSPVLRITSGGNVGIGTTAPGTMLDVTKASTSTLTNLTQAITGQAIAVSSNYTANNYVPGLEWYTSDDNPTKPKGGIFLQEVSSGSLMNLMTSDSFATGLTRTGLSICPSGASALGGICSPGTGGNSLTINDTNNSATGGTVISMTSSGTTLTAQKFLLNLNGSADTATNQNYTGILLAIPGTGANNTATAKTYTGISVTGGNIVHSALAGTDTFTGLGITMPGITQTAGTVTSYGVKVTGGTVTSGKAYAFISDSNAGNVGIATAAPGTTLDVTGTGRFSSTLTASNGLTLTTGALSLTGTSGSTTLTGYGLSSVTSTTGTGNINTWADSSFNVAAAATGNLANLTFTNISVNTTGTSTVAGLNIAGTNTSSGTGGIMETYGIKLQALAGTAVNGTQNNYGMRIGNYGQSGAELSYGLYVDSQSGSTSNYAAVFAGGNVGIGTTAPSSLFVVNGGVNQIALFQGTGSPMVTVNSTGSDGGTLALSGTGGSWSTIGGTDYAVIQGGFTTRFIVKAGGNVGIGTTTPAATLHVVGPTQASINTNALATFTVTGGVGGAGSGGTGGIGGAISMVSGFGGSGITGSDAGGNGAPLTLAGGDGGSGGSALGARGAGGNVYIYGGNIGSTGSVGIVTPGNVFLGVTAAGVSQGNVGIGTTTTSNYNLAVNGTAYLSGLSFSSGTIGGIAAPGSVGGNHPITLNATGTTTAAYVAFQTNGSEAMRVQGGSGNIGIGITAPISVLQVNRDNTTTNGSLTQLNITGNLTTTPAASSANSIYGLNVGPNYSGTGTLASGATNAIYGIQSNPQNLGSGTISTLWGLYSVPSNASTGIVNDMRGVRALANNSSSGSVITMVGVDAVPYNQGSGAVTTAEGVLSETYNSGTISTLYNFYSAAPAGGGTITNKYAFVSDLGAGNVGIGTITPDALLQVGGATSYAHLGSAGIGAWPVLTTYSYFGTDANKSTAGSYTLITDGTNSIMNSATGGSISLRTNNGLIANNNSGNYVCYNTSATGSLSYAASCTPSAQRFKHDIVPLDQTSGISELMKLTPVAFTYNPDIDPSQQRLVGFIAEQVNTIDPRLVYTGTDGQLQGVRYENLTSILAKAVQEQQGVINSQGNVITTTTAQVNMNTQAINNLQTNGASNSAVLSLGTQVISLSTKVDTQTTQLTSLTGQVSQLTDLVNMLASSSAGFTASGSASFLSGADLDVHNATIAGALTVLGHTTLGDLGVTGNITAGLLTINGLDDAGKASINTVGDLYLQKTGTGGINLFAGKMTIDKTGNLTTSGVLSGKTVVTEELQISSPSATGSATVGSATLQAGSTEQMIQSTKVKSNSRIFVTPRNDTNGHVPFVTDLHAGQSFGVKISVPLLTDLQFDWWIVN